ncbi:OLC1v1006307C3 [Oldenlandia corymbosa var. corymbosa]|uniref:OLC1v1006307C3 n=1 Tax=Oldenlandia corymbosa var. corymbosa TaxID=529605 RepID=A0AAV1DGR8_OLDCO|nr:OLC1v1006307C3 [Oldenlandia corymbosa var. corymbosa]
MEAGGGGDATTASDSIKVKIQFGGRSIPVEISVDSTVKNLKSTLQPLTNVLPRGQKLICKGKVLEDEMTLKSLGITNGSKIMLMASQGLHQGSGPLKKEVPAKKELERVQMNTIIPMVTRENKAKAAGPNPVQRWKSTGVVALSEHGLKAIPEEVYGLRSFVRVLDLSRNSIQEIPDKINLLSSIQKLFLNANNLVDGSLSWKGLESLKSLTILSLSHNSLSELPPAVGALTSLRQLQVENNDLISLPSEIELLTELQILKVNNNRINRIPDSIGGCISLVEVQHCFLVSHFLLYYPNPNSRQISPVDLSSNLLVELPETVGNLKDLKALYLSNNGLHSLPRTLFKTCGQLSILDLHGTEVTMDLLRQFEGWEDFDTRRRLKHQKQLDFRVTSSAEFDEGADKS